MIGRSMRSLLFLTVFRVQRYMKEMIETRRNAETKEERYDLLSSLLDANEDTSKGGITDQELLGALRLLSLFCSRSHISLSEHLHFPYRRYVLQTIASTLFAEGYVGHETTAHTLCFALGLLALYQDEQERAFQEIKKALPDGRDPVRCPRIRMLCVADSIASQTFQDLPALAFAEA